MSYTCRVPRVRLPLSIVPCIVLAVAMTGCGIVGGASATHTPTATATATPTDTPTSTFTPTSTPTPQPTDTPAPTATPRPQGLSVAQARTTTVRAAGNGAASARLTFLGMTRPMVADGADFWLPIGASADTAVGSYPMTIAFYDAAGNAIDTEKDDVQVTHRDFPVEEIDVPPGQDNLLSPAEVQKEQNIRSQIFAEYTPQKLWESPFIFPVQGTITSPFGIGRSYNGAPVTSHHTGLDIAANEGTPVYAAASGKVVWADALTTRGNTVMIDHGLGVFTGYSHLSHFEVAVGQDVKQGQLIAEVGHTGLATGPHLHWELIIGGENVDPSYWTYQGVAP